MNPTPGVPAQLPDNLIPVGPVPTAFIVGAGYNDGTQVVVLITDTPLGRQQYVVDVETADHLVNQLTTAVRQARTGLVVATEVPQAPPVPEWRSRRANGRSGGSSGHQLSGS